MSNILAKDFYENCYRITHNDSLTPIYSYYCYNIRNEENLIKAIQFCENSSIGSKIINPSELKKNNEAIIHINPTKKVLIDFFNKSNKWTTYAFTKHQAKLDKKEIEDIVIKHYYLLEHIIDKKL